MEQAILVFRKNLKIYIRERQYISELAAPTIIFIILLSTKNADAQTKKSTGQFLPMSLLILCRGMVTTMIAEKSERQKETQKIMGLKQSSYVIGWLISNFGRLALVTLYFLLLTLSTDTLTSTTDLLTKPEVALSFIMYGFSIMSLSYFITTLFDVPKSGADFAIFLNIIGSVGTQLVTVEYFQQNAWLVYLCSLIPSFCYAVFPYFQMIGINDATYTKGDYFLMLTIDIVLYLLLYLYADQVIPNEYGTNKHPLFFLGKKKKQQVQDIDESSTKIQIDLESLKQPLYINDSNAIDSSSAIFHETLKSTKNRAIYINDLKKQFGTTKAVDGLSLSIYSSQILCLLGHNGAGKTTTISLLTGLIKKDNGQIEYFGESVEDHLDQIRTYLGVCPQKDVLYDSLSVEDHLNYYGKIKGLNGINLTQEIENVIEKCALSNERTKLAKNLSGGNKRKLCLAMAIIGGSRIIFLDEPTSGMDPVSRKKIWDILIQLKNEGKCLVLTTHHLDEAEILSERIAVMAKGKLLTIGSVDFVKKKFGIGYHLNLYNIGNEEKQWIQKSIQLDKLVKQYINESKLNSQQAKECISFQIPFDQKQGLLQLFENLENDKSIQINLMMNTLEEAFINIGMDEQQFLQNAGKQSFIDNDNNNNNNNNNQIDIYDEFAKIIPPICLEQPPTYSFYTQFYACFIRKIYQMNIKRIIVQLIIPTTFMFAGPFISSVTLTDEIKKQENYLYIWAIICIITSFAEITFGITIMSASMGAMPVQERQLKQKYALNVMGCRILPFWLANFSFDMLTGIYLWTIYIIAVFIFDQTPLKYVSIFITLIFYFSAYITLSYLMSWLFSDFLFAVRFMIFIMMFIFYMLPFVLYLLIQNSFLIWILTFIFPSISFYGELNAILITNYNQDGFIITQQPIVYILVLIFQTLLYFTLTLLIDSRKLLATQNQSQLVVSKDPDVIIEQQRVQSQLCDDRVIARKISKTYANGYSAVKGTSFGVEPGQIFGLLGPNGAGKSTTFNMITCRLKPTTGQIFLQNQEIDKGKGAIFQNVGICPQFDSLYEMMTPVQHLTIWAYLKGLSGLQVKESVEYFLNVMQLTAYAKTPAAQLSGGNKRKLCVSLALMGGSNMQFFDEPSSGVDPIARRFLWNSIQQGVKLRQSSVILTTHTMDEAESLCHKIAIQVNGSFACMGTPQHLKRKFGEGYRVSLDVINMDQEDEIKGVVLNQFQGSELLEDNISNKLTFKLSKEGFSFYQTFSFFMEKMQNEWKFISDFQLNQSTLEQVFMHFASQQEASLNDELTMKKQARKFTGICGNDEDD